MPKKTNYPPDVIVERIQRVFWDNEIKDYYAAARIGVHENTISDYRRGIHYPSVRFIRWLCTEYKINPYWLLDLKEPESE